MLLVASYYFTCSVVVHVVGTEYGLGIVGTEGVELLQIIAEKPSVAREIARIVGVTKPRSRTQRHNKGEDASVFRRHSS